MSNEILNVAYVDSAPADPIGWKVGVRPDGALEIRRVIPAGAALESLDALIMSAISLFSDTARANRTPMVVSNPSGETLWTEGNGDN